MKPLLLAAMLTGCSHQLTAACAFGAEHERGAETCAVQNFGAEAAAKRKKRMAECATTCAVLPNAPECVVNCPART